MGLVPVYQEPSLIPDLSSPTTCAWATRRWSPSATGWRSLACPTCLDAMIRSPAAGLAAHRRPCPRAGGRAGRALLDEMTAALPTDLVDRVLKTVRAQADAGRSVIYISHRFTEIAAICDRATVLRDGLTVGDVAIEPGIEERIVEMMLGGAVAAAVARRAPGKADPSDMPRLRVKGLKTGTRLTDVSFDLHRARSWASSRWKGRARTSCSTSWPATAAQRGTVEVDGTPAFSHPADAIAAGLTLVPGDRAHALLMSRSVRENIAVPLLARIRNWGAIRMGDATQGRRRHRDPADRHPRAGRGAPAVGRQPAEGHHRALDRQGGADAAAVRPDARDRHPHQAADLRPGPRPCRSGGGGAFYTSELAEIRRPATAPW
jgi:ribose transport system ATP-binding protein